MESKVIEQAVYGDIEICQFDNDEDIVIYADNGELEIFVTPTSIPSLITALASFCTPEQLETIINELKKDKG